MSMYVLTHLHAVRYVNVAPFESSRHVVGFLRDGWMDESGEREGEREDITGVLSREQNLPDAVNGGGIVDGLVFLVDRIIVQYRLG